MLNPNKLSGHRDWLYIPATSFTGLCPYTHVTGGDASITAIGLADDAAGSRFAKTAATDRVSRIAQHMAGLTVNGTANNPVAVTCLDFNYAPTTVGLAGVVFPTFGDKIQHLMRVPSNMSFDHPLRVRLAWSTDLMSVGQSATWVVKYKPIVPNVTVLSTASLVALSTAIPADTWPIAGSVPGYAETEDGIINAQAITDASRAIHWEVELNTAAAAGLVLLGMILEYSTRPGRGKSLARRAYQAP